jgi:HTH-type transcriptional regulator, sugar sensing transcriptional regulator
MPALRNAFEALKSCGFGDYEARAYCALLAASPANGYQIARASGIPRAKVYETLERLTTRGAVVQVEGSGSGGGPAGKLYAPIDFNEFLEEIEKNARSACGQARKALKRYRGSPRTVEVIWRVTSEQELISRGRDLADAASECLHVAVWATEFEALLPELTAAVQRGVRLALILYESHPGLKQLQKLGAGAVGHSRSKTEAVPLMGRQFTLVADRLKCISGSIFDQGGVEGVYSPNRGLVINAVDLVNHEIYVERILKEVGKPVWNEFGRYLGKLDAFDVPRT